MARSKLLTRLSRRTGLPDIKVKEFLDRFLNSIVEVLVEEQRLKLRGFGVFEVKHRVARTRYNPRTGQPVHVPAHKKVTFKPSREMKRTVHRNLAGIPS